MLAGTFLNGLLYLIPVLTGRLKIVEFAHNPCPVAPFALGFLTGLLNYDFLALVEEGATRGQLIRNLAEGLSARKPPAAAATAILTSAVLFALLHLMNGTEELRRVIVLAAFGAIPAAIYFVTGELAFPIGLHLATDFISLNVFATGHPADYTLLVCQDTGLGGGPEPGSGNDPLCWFGLPVGGRKNPATGLSLPFEPLPFPPQLKAT